MTTVTDSVCVAHDQDRTAAQPDDLLTAAANQVARIGAMRFVVLLTAATTTLFALSDEDGPVLCPFRRCTGGYCPGCGLTRSGGRLVRGDLAGSWHQHPYLMLGLAQVGLAAALWQLGGRRLQASLQRVGGRLLAANLALLGGIWVVRLFDGSIPVPFAG